MKNTSTILFALLLLIVLGVSACSDPAIPKEGSLVFVENDSTPIVYHNSGNSIDWEGIYYGTTPCADCSGINTSLRLNKDETFVITFFYEGKGKVTYVEQGKFVWDKYGTIVTLKGVKDKPNQYQVGEKCVFQLDMNGQKITGNLAGNYILKLDESQNAN
jgi:uncharacterized lipoprotein NlpE involved in copper resistance